MTPTTDQSDYHFTNIKFFQAAGPIFNLVHDYNLRSWALNYAIWLRDRRYVTLPAPPIPSAVDYERAAEIRTQLDSIAEKFFGK